MAPPRVQPSSLDPIMREVIPARPVRTDEPFDWNNDGQNDFLYRRLVSVELSDLEKGKRFASVPIYWPVLNLFRNRLRPFKTEAPCGYEKVEGTKGLRKIDTWAFTENDRQVLFFSSKREAAYRVGDRFRMDRIEWVIHGFQFAIDSRTKRPTRPHALVILDDVSRLVGFPEDIRCDRLVPIDDLSKTKVVTERAKSHRRK